MKVVDKEKFYKRLWIYKYLIFLNFSTDIDDDNLKVVINALNIKGRKKRFNYIIDEACLYIDNYYSKCNLCHFKNNKCTSHRKRKLDFINGCCHVCKYQSTNGCTVKNVACKLFNCSYVDYNGLTPLKSNDIMLLKLLNFYERYVLTHDFYEEKKKVIFDMYMGTIHLLLLLFSFVGLLVMMLL